MKKFFIAMLLLFSINSNVIAQWILTNAPQGIPIYTFASSGSNVFAGADLTGLVATGGTVFLSTNNGLDWSIIGVTPDCPEIRTIVLEDNKIFAGSFGGGVFLSTNMGANWTNVSNGLTDMNIYTLLLIPNGLGGNNIYAGTMGGGVFISTNYGTNWYSVNNGLTDLGIYSLAYLKNQVNDVVLFAGTYSGLFYSTNYGENWSKRANTQYFTQVVVSGANIFAAGIWHLWFSTDQGLSWTDVTTGLSNLPVWALATYSTNVFTLTNWGNIFLSTNNGAEWTLINEGIIDTLVLAIGITDNYIFASGVVEGLWRRSLSEIISSVDNKNELLKEFALYQNYPNPFNPTTTIAYSIPLLGGARGGFVKLRVYDILGNEIATLVNEEKEAGYHSIDFNGSDLPSGVYFYRIQVYPANGGVGEFISTKKMVLIR